MLKKTTNHMLSYLSRTGEASPFAIFAQYITKAVLEAAKTRSDVLAKVLKKKFRDMSKHFEGMIEDGVEKPVEEPVRDAFKTYLVKALEEFNKVQADLERIKAKYKDEDEEQ